MDLGRIISLDNFLPKVLALRMILVCDLRRGWFHIAFVAEVAAFQIGDFGFIGVEVVAHKACQSVRVSLFEAGENVNCGKAHVRVNVHGDMPLLAVSKHGIFVDTVLVVDVYAARFHAEACRGVAEHMLDADNVVQENIAAVIHINGNLCADGFQNGPSQNQ